MDLIKKVMTENEEIVEKYRKGKKGVIGVLIGQVIRLTKGRAQPQKIKDLLEKELGK
jgi:aspartyl-tRNA(Asn)/glutamyl-tRNA(Gln) amidotransferase subunit B